MNKAITVISVVFGLIVLAGGIVFYYWVAPTIRDGVKLMNANMASIYKLNTEQYKDQFLLDEKEIKKLNIFSNDYHRTGKDAADFLNRDFNKVRKPKSGSFLELPLSLTNQLVINSENWMGIKRGEELSDVDFNWLAELKDYEYWSEEKFSPVEDNYKQDKLYNFFDKPVTMPYLAFYHWAQLRWVKYIADKKNFPQKELRHLANLMHSRGTLDASLIAIKILSLEVNVAEVYPEDFKGSILTQFDITRLTRFIYAASGILRTAIFSPSHYDLFYQIDFGKCASVEGSMPLFFMLYKPVFHSVWTDYYARMTDILKGEKCSRKRYLNIWGNDEFTQRHMQGRDVSELIQKHFSIQDKGGDYAFQSFPQDVKGEDIFQLAKYQLLAKVFSTSLMSVSSPDPWEFYGAE